MANAPRLRVALYGRNGHQLTHLLREPHPLVEIVALCEVELPEGARVTPPVLPSLDALLAENSIEMISLCSPWRSQQAADSIRCLEAGKHVLAEKPAALSESSLDEILRTAERTGKSFREMGGTVFQKPFLAMREIVRRGDLGEIVQVFAQKSYPYYPGRAQDEALDGGLFLQNGVHAARFIEHVSGQRIVSLSRIETELGNPGEGHLRMASAFQGILENGGCASAIANYLNPPGLGSWGNESLRVFGTKGMAEATDAGKRSRLVIGDRDLGPIDPGPEPLPYFTQYIQGLLGVGEMPLTLEEELHPLRALLRAKPSFPEVN